MPFDFFSKTPIPSKITPEMEIVIEDLKKSPDQMTCLKNAYTILTKKYHGGYLETYIHLFSAFEQDIDNLWAKEGFLHCTNINFILRTLLIKSEFFTEDDIRLQWTLIGYVSPHQYLEIRIEDTWIAVDVWANVYGIQFGDKAHGFH